MYSLDINFLKDPNRKPEEAASVTTKKKPKQPVGAMVPMVAGLALMVILPGLAFLGVIWSNGQKEEVNAQIVDLEAQIQEADADSQIISELQTEFDTVKAETDALINVFNEIQPISAIFKDLLEQVPQGVQVDSVNQNDDQLTINGIATSYYEANDFLLTLKDSSFFIPEETFLTSVDLTGNPLSIEEVPETLIVELPEQVVSYNIQTTIESRPASEILDLLSSKGALGLVSRIKILQEKGVITKE